MHQQLPVLDVFLATIKMLSRQSGRITCKGAISILNIRAGFVDAP